MSQQIIKTGTIPNDRSGDSLFAAFNKVNANFEELYTLTSSYTPTVDSNWAGSPPTTIQEAIDRLAAAIKVLNTTGA